MTTSRKLSSRFLPIAYVATALWGCSSSSHVIVGTTRPPTSPEQVKVYTRPPEKYEEIAILEASSKASFSLGDQRKTDKVIERLKIEAAKLGANGVLLQGMSDQSAGSIGTGLGSASVSRNTAFGSGIDFSTGMVNKAGKGLAIYVAQP